MQTSVYIDLNKNNQFDHGLSDLSGRVRDSLFWINGFTNPGEIESNAIAHISPVNQLRIVLDNRDGELSLENLGAEYYSLIYSGLQVKVTVEHDLTSHSFTYYTNNIQVNPGEYGSQTVSIDCVCAMPRLQRATYAPVIETDVRTDTALSNMMGEAVVTLPYTSSYFLIDASQIDGTDVIFDETTSVAAMTDFEVGESTLSYVGDVVRQTDNDLPNQKAHVFAADICIAEGFGRFFYQARDGKFHFHNRYHDRLTAASLSLDTGDLYRVMSTMTNVYNKVRLHITPRSVAESESVMFRSDSVPITIPAGEQKRVRVRFNDPNNADVAIAALNPVDPVRNTDVIYQAGITHTSDIGGTGGTIFFDNPTASNLDVTTIQVRGTPITIYESEVAETEDASSMYQYNRNDLPDIRGAYITDSDFADRIVTFLLNRHKTARQVYNSVTIVVDDDNFADVMAKSVGDVVTIADTWSGHSETYVVLGEYHQIDIGGGSHQVTWYLRSNDTTPIFLIDTSEIDGTDIIGI